MSLSSASSPPSTPRHAAIPSPASGLNVNSISHPNNSSSSAFDHLEHSVAVFQESFAARLVGLEEFVKGLSTKVDAIDAQLSPVHPLVVHSRTCMK